MKEQVKEREQIRAAIDDSIIPSLTHQQRQDSRFSPSISGERVLENKKFASQTDNGLE